MKKSTPRLLLQIKGKKARGSSATGIYAQPDLASIFMPK